MWRGDDQPELLTFEAEQGAVDYCADFLRPFCKPIVREPVLGNGLRPDLGFRLNACPSVPLVLECKKFGDGKISALGKAIRQASDYAETTRHIALVGPVKARGPTHLSWQASPIGAMALLAGQFSVGLLYVHPQGGGGIFIGGQAVVRFESGQARMHSNAAVLLAFKSRWGSDTCRRVA